MTISLLSAAIAVAIVVLAVAVWIRAIEAGFWLALAIVGQAASLLLIDAGPTVHYQHFRSVADLVSGTFNAPLSLVIVQTLLVVFGLMGRRSRLASIFTSNRRLLKRWQWIALAVILVATSATLSRDPRYYLQELVIATTVQFVMLSTIVLFAIALPSRVLGAAAGLIRRMLNGDEVHRSRRVDWFFIAGALWVVLVSVFLAVFVYERHPHIPDEVSYIYQARYFAHGALTMPSPPVPSAFDLDLMTYEPNRWYSPVPPGWPALLAIGERFGLAWLVNPLLAGINVLLASLLVENLYDKKTARMTCLLLCVSPWHLFMAMNFMTHTAVLTYVLAAAYSVQRMRATGNYLWGVPGGIALGLLSWIRPLDGVTIAIALGLWSLAARGKKFRLAPAFVLTVVTIAVGSIQLAYNSVVSGQATIFPINKYLDLTYGPGVNDLGFGANRGRGINGALDAFPGHGLGDVLVNANLNTTVINTELFGWGVGSLLLIGLLVLSGGMAKTEYQLGAVILLIVGVQSLYWFSGGPDFGARYWYPVILPCIVLAVRGLDWLVRRLDSIGDEFSGTRAFVGVAALIFCAAITFFPWRAADKYHHYRGMLSDVRELSTREPFGRSVVFVRGNRHPDYSSAAIYNPLDLRADAPIFVWDRDSGVREQVLMAYSDRPVWFLNGPTLTGRGYEIAGGPLTIEQAERFPGGESPSHDQAKE